MFKKGIERTIENLKEIAKDVDRTYGSINESYKIYRFGADLHYSENVKNRIPLNLFQKQRKILREGDIIIKYNEIKEPKLLRFILLDNVIIICDVVKQGSIELKYILLEPLPIFKHIVTETNIGYSFERFNLENMFSLFLSERAGTEIVVMFFKDARLKKMYFDDIQNAIENLRKSFNENIKLCTLLKNINYDILCCSTRDTSFSAKGERNEYEAHLCMDGSNEEKNYDEVKNDNDIEEKQRKKDKQR